MTEKKHPHIDTNTTKNTRHKEHDALRDAFGVVVTKRDTFVAKHDEEGGGVDESEEDEEGSRYVRNHVMYYSVYMAT